MSSPSSPSGSLAAPATVPPVSVVPGRQTIPPIRAVEYIRRMRGGAQAQLMRCSDGNYYVVKFQNNPQGVKILANELLGGRIARLLGLSVTPGTVMWVCRKLVRYSDELYIEMLHSRTPCEPGLCFGSRFAADPTSGLVLDLMPDILLPNVENFGEFLGMLVFDLWTGNTDGRQVVFVRNDTDSRYRAQMIDQGFCFHGSSWDFPDSPLRATYSRWLVYKDVRSIDAFEPWLTHVEQTGEDEIAAAAEGLPGDWYGSSGKALRALLGQLCKRRTKVRELLWRTRDVARQLFPNWIPPIQSKITQEVRMQTKINNAEASPERKNQKTPEEFVSLVQDLKSINSRLAALIRELRLLRPLLRASDLRTARWALQELQSAAGGDGHGSDAVENLTATERKCILNALIETKGNKIDAARVLGIGKTTLYRKLQGYRQLVEAGGTERANVGDFTVNPTQP